MSERYDLIVNLLREVRADQKVSVRDIGEIKIEVALNRQDLELHMARTTAVEELTVITKEELITLINLIEKKHDGRIELIEKKLSVTYLLKLIVTVASGIGAVSGAVYTIIKLIGNL